MSAPPTRHAPPWLFGVLVIPFGIVVGYSDNALSYVLSERGLSTDIIGVVVALVGLPHAWKFLWAPALDAGTKRKHWLVGSVVAGAACVAIASLILPNRFENARQLTRLEAFTALVCIAEAAIATSSAAVDALMAITLPNEKKGAAAGWSMAGNLGGTGLGGALTVWITRHVQSHALVAAILFVTILAFGLPGLLLVEEQPERHPPLKAMANLVKDVVATVRSRAGWTGLLICLTPVGTGGATKLFGALSAQYIADDLAREKYVLFVNGIVGGLVSAGGCLLGGYLADRMNRRLLYVVGGAVTAISAIAMALAPATATTFTVGCLAYSFCNGICYAAFAAFVLEMIGHGPGVATKYQLFVGASNFAISYTAVLDGFGDQWGPRVFHGAPFARRLGVLGTDAMLTFAGVTVLGLMALYLRRNPLPPVAALPATVPVVPAAAPIADA